MSWVFWGLTSLRSAIVFLGEWASSFRGVLKDLGLRGRPKVQTADPRESKPESPRYDAARRFRATENWTAGRPGAGF